MRLTNSFTLAAVVYMVSIIRPVVGECLKAALVKASSSFLAQSLHSPGTLFFWWMDAYKFEFACLLEDIFAVVVVYVFFA